MKGVSILFCILLLHTATAQQPAMNRLMVKFRPTVSYSFNHKTNLVTTADAELAFVLNSSHILKISTPVPQGIEKSNLKSVSLISGIFFFDIDPAADEKNVMANLNASGFFQYVGSDAVASGSGVPSTTASVNDTYFFRQWGLFNDGTFSSSAIAGADVKMQGAWDITTGNSNTIVCILDTGIKLDHPEFAGRLWTNPGEIPGNGIDDDNNGYIDDINGWDWVNTDNNPTDDYGHGTNVAGIAVATGNNGNGYAGVNWKCRIMAGKVLNASNSGSYSWMTDGILYAAVNGAKVINMSIGGSSFSQTLKNACDFCYANDVALLACMMNYNNEVTYYPAGFSSTIAIGATDVNDHRVAPFFWSATSGSNYGNHIDVVAPGNYIYGLNYQSNTNFNTYWGGTSQATPLVAGVASLICALKPAITVEEIRTILRTTAQDQVGDPFEDTPGWDKYMGAGRINANAAIRSVYPCSAEGIKFTAGAVGTTYQWQADTGNDFINISDDMHYSGTNSATLQITNAPTSWYGYQYRCLVDNNEGAASVLRFTSYWVGGNNSAWENPANWNCGILPDENTDVIINNANPWMPVISSNAFCRTAAINKGITVTVTPGFNLTVKK